MIQLFGLIQKFDVGGNIRFFRFLGFFGKNLKPKKWVWGGKNEKMKNQNVDFGSKWKVFFYESVLIF